MSDFGTRLGRALDAGAAGAPDATGLAAAARGRAKARRNRAVAAGVVAAVVAVVFPVVLLVADPPDDAVPPVIGEPTEPEATQDPSQRTDVEGGFQYLGRLGVRIEIPAAWLPSECGPGVARYDPDGGVGAPECDPVGLSFLNDTFRPADGKVSGEVYLEESSGADLWTGFRWTRQGAILVTTEDPHLTQRILGSAVGEMWPRHTHDGVVMDIPFGWEEVDCPDAGWAEIGPPTACSDQTGIAFYRSALFDPAYGPGEVRSEDGKRWVGYVHAGEYAVSVVTLDRDLTDRVLTTVRDE